MKVVVASLVVVSFASMSLLGERKLTKDVAEGRVTFRLSVKLLGIEQTESPSLKWGGKVDIICETSRWPIVEERRPLIKTVTFTGLRNLCIAKGRVDKEYLEEVNGVPSGFVDNQEYVAVFWEHVLGEGKSQIPTADRMPDEEAEKKDVEFVVVRIPCLVARIPDDLRPKMKGLASGKQVSLGNSLCDSFRSDIGVWIFPGGIYRIRLLTENEEKEPGLRFPYLKQHREWAECFQTEERFISNNFVVAWEEIRAKEK